MASCAKVKYYPNDGWQVFAEGIYLYVRLNMIFQFKGAAKIWTLRINFSKARPKISHTLFLVLTKI